MIFILFIDVLLVLFLCKIVHTLLDTDKISIEGLVSIYEFINTNIIQLDGNYHQIRERMLM